MNLQLNSSHISDKTKPNVLLLTIDSLRVDHMSGYGYSSNTSPTIDRLIKSGKKFTMAFSHGGGTPEAFPSILAGVPPPVNIQQCDLGLRRGSSIVRELRKNGYTAGAFNSNPYLSRFFGYSDDFDLFYHNLQGLTERRHTVTGGGIFPYLKLVTGQPPIIRGEKLVKRFGSWLGQINGPFFAWIHFMDTHMPYLPPSEYVRLFASNPSSRFYMVYLYRKMYESNKRVYRTLNPVQSTLGRKDLSRIVEYYDGAIRYVDSCIGELLGVLESNSSLQDTVIFITADHGELLGEHGLVDHGFLYEQLIHVPLIIAGGQFMHEEVDSPVTHLLIPKTILELAGIDNSIVLNNNLYSNIDSGIISSVVDIERNMYSVRTKDWHLIDTFDIVKNKHYLELYDLVSDPDETDNVYESHRDLADTFYQRIQHFIEANSSTVPVANPGLSKDDERELSKRLRELGYE